MLASTVIRNSTFLAAENREFGRFVHCKHPRFFEFLELLNEGFLGESWFWGVRVWFEGFGVAKVRLTAH